MKLVSAILAAVLASSGTYAWEEKATLSLNAQAVRQRLKQTETYRLPRGDYRFARGGERAVPPPPYIPTYIRTYSGYVEECQWPGQEIALFDEQMVSRGYRTCQ